MAKTILRNATVFINGQDLTDHVSSVTIEDLLGPVEIPEPNWIRVVWSDDADPTRTFGTVTFFEEGGLWVQIPFDRNTLVAMPREDLEEIAKGMARRMWEDQHPSAIDGRQRSWLRRFSPNPEVEKLMDLDKEVRQQSQGRNMLVADLNEDGSFTPRVVPA